jgi:hypothetical protein
MYNLLFFLKLLYEGTGPHGERQVTFIDILAGWSCTSSNNGSLGSLVVDNRSSSRSSSPLPTSTGSTNNSRNNSRASSRASTPLFLNSMRSSSPLSSSSPKSRAQVKRQGRFEGVDVGDFLEMMNDFSICPDLIPLSECRAIFTRRMAMSQQEEIGGGISSQIFATPQKQRKTSLLAKGSGVVSETMMMNGVTRSDAIRRTGNAVISATCEIFASLICDVAHVGFGTYPYDASVSTFGEKLLVLLWRMQQCTAGVQYIGLRTSMLTGGETTLFGTLPNSAPTSVDEIRRIRREKRPDLALQLLGRKMDNALPHERQVWARASSPRAPGLGPKASRSASRKKRISSPPNGPSTFGTSARKGDYEERVRQKRLMQQMATSQTDWDGKKRTR